MLVPREGGVDTIAVGSILAAADLRQISEGYQNTANFVDAFFTGSQSLVGPENSPKWQEVNFSAEVPGLPRYPPAAHARFSPSLASSALKAR